MKATRPATDLVSLAAALGAMAGVTAVWFRWLHVSNVGTVSTSFLLIVLVVAATSRLWVAVVTSVVGMLLFNFFFLPPVGTFTIADPQNWVALFAFLTVSLVASQLSATARARTREALGRRDELLRLFDLSRDVLMITDSDEALSILARAVARRFDLTSVTIALPRGDAWTLFSGGTDPETVEPSALSRAFARAESSPDLVPLRVGAKPIGLLAVAGRRLEMGTFHTLAGVVALAIDRAALLEARATAEITRQREELKTALLASLGHDLRTPLTTIRVAASNMQGAWLTDAEREEQSGLILAEVERLTRLFQNILDMARIDAGAVAAEAQWVYLSEIVEAARDHVGPTLAHHTLEVVVTNDVAVWLDPRLTTTALAHVLENAAHYSPTGTAIVVTADAGSEGLEIAVRDHGPGISPVDLPHLFERFYRGASAHVRPSGSGMGLAIARGLLAAEGGRLWVESSPEGGALFKMTVPARIRTLKRAARQ